MNNLERIEQMKRKDCEVLRKGISEDGTSVITRKCRRRAIETHS